MGEKHVKGHGTSKGWYGRLQRVGLLALLHTRCLQGIAEHSDRDPWNDQIFVDPLFF